MDEPEFPFADCALLVRLRHYCDTYMLADKSAGVTHFDVDGISDVRDFAKAALNIYNEEEQKNFYLQKVVKLNQVVKYYYLTFWAEIADSDESRLFRAVVDPIGFKVLLCEIKDCDDMIIPFYHQERSPIIPTREEDHPSYTRFDLSRGLAVGEGGVDLASVGFYCDYAGYYSEEVVDDLSRLRDVCDICMDPGRPKGQCGGVFTLFKVDGLSYVREAAKAALNAYNEEKKMNFNLEKVAKLNQLSTYVFLTFWARNAESHDRRLFRAVVEPLHGNKVLLCEIKDDEEITIPAGYKDYGVETESEEDHCPDTWSGSDLTEGSAGSSPYINCGSTVGFPFADCALLVRLRHYCDTYMHADGCTGVTHFDVDGISDVRDLAKAALNIYNEEEQKNFYLEKVVKLNQVVKYSYLTFWARMAESDERRLFRAAVDPIGFKVLLCEIKDFDDMIIPFYHKERSPCIPAREEDHPSYTRFDLSRGLAVGEGGVDLASVGFYCDYAGYYSEEVVDDLSNLRDRCDIYMDPGRLKSQCGGGFTLFKVDDLSYVRDAAKAALNAYNEEKKMNFNLEKVAKLNQLSTYVYLTFWAHSAESHDRHLFRAVVVPLYGNKVLLCEIKDYEEIMIPAGHKEYGFETESEKGH